MASGTFIRLLIGLSLFISPFLTVYFTGDNSFWALLFLYLFIPFIISWENACNCSGCILSNRCDERKRFNFVKNLFIFVGFDKETINNIKLTYNVENTYKGMYHYIKDNYERIYNV